MPFDHVSLSEGLQQLPPVRTRGGQGVERSPKQANDLKRPLDVKFSSHVSLFCLTSRTPSSAV
eukprot:1016955-Amorphochlora_amoeboformis.AAC.2